MSQIPKWFERKFDFSFPAEFYPNICIRLRGTPARLEELVRGGSREMLIHKREGKWSAQEHAGHLLDLEPLGMARMRDFVQGGKELTPADLGNRRTHEANHNAKPIEEIVSEFRKERMAMMDYVGQQESALFGQTLVHPRLKQPMRLVDYLYFVAEHDDHHLAWIWELTGG
jgi:uncharacterized damage-inducible protein DinB